MVWCSFNECHVERHIRLAGFLPHCQCIECGTWSFGKLSQVTWFSICSIWLFLRGGGRKVEGLTSPMATWWKNCSYLWVINDAENLWIFVGMPLWLARHCFLGFVGVENVAPGKQLDLLLVLFSFVFIFYTFGFLYS